MKVWKIVYWVATVLLTAMMLFSVSMYVLNHGEVVKAWVKLGFPPYLIYPLATAKALGLLAIWTKKSAVLKEWAYAGFFFNFSLAASAHIAAGDGEAAGAIGALVILALSYIGDKKIY